jgi:putative transposase
MYLWRAVDHKGEILDRLVQCCRDKRAGLQPMRKTAHEARVRAELLVTDKLRSFVWHFGFFG